MPLAFVTARVSADSLRRSFGMLLTEAGPLAELLSVGDLDQGDLVLGAESDDELLVGLLLAGLVEDTHVGLAAVQGLAGLAQTAGETVVHQRQLQHSLQGVQDGHLALGGGIGGDFDLLGDFGGVLFYVRLQLGAARVSLGSSMGWCVCGCLGRMHGVVSQHQVHTAPARRMRRGRSLARDKFEPQHPPKRIGANLTILMVGLSSECRIDPRRVVVSEILGGKENSLNVGNFCRVVN